MTEQNEKNINEYLKEKIRRLKDIYKCNPELAKKIATEDLIKAGFIDEKGNLLPPYNGQKVNDTDFTRIR